MTGSSRSPRTARPASSAATKPKLGFFIGLLIRPNQKAIEERELAAGEKKKCPFCAELIKAEAVVCRFCGKEVPKVVVREEFSIPRGLEVPDLRRARRPDPEEGPVGL